MLLERDALLRLVAVVELLPGVLDAQLRDIGEALLARLDPEGRMTVLCDDAGRAPAS